MENQKGSNSLEHFFEIEGFKEKANFLSDLLHQYSVEYAISHTGSIKGNVNEKNRSGQSYLYKKLGMESEVLEIKMRDKIHISYLQMATDTALKRYPYLTVKLVEKDGDFYLVENPIPVIVKEMSTLRSLGSSRVNYHLIDITCKKTTMFISFHHALCDGEGIKPFVETQLYYYCLYRYNMRKKRQKPVSKIRLANDPLLEGETNDPFLIRYETSGKEYPKISRDGFALDENVKTDDSQDYRYEIRINHAAFLSFAKKNNATPAIAVGLIMNQAIRNLYPNFDKPVICNIALSMRAALGCENTFKNCVRSMAFHYTKALSERPLKEQATEYRRILNEQREPDYVKTEANEQIGLFEKLDQLDSYEKKQKIMSFFEEMLLNTYIISYLGQFNLGYNEKYIHSINLYNSGVTGLGINVIAAGQYFLLGFKQSFPSDRYVCEFAAVLKGYGLDCEVSDCIPFTTPTDSLIKRKTSC